MKAVVRPMVRGIRVGVITLRFLYDFNDGPLLISERYFFGKTLICRKILKFIKAFKAGQAWQNGLGSYELSCAFHSPVYANVKGVSLIAGGSNS